MLRVPRNGVRPAQDQLRQAIFSSLGEAVVDARVLDLFAGTGAYGIEALSRGAASVCWVERDARTLADLKGNVRSVLSPEAFQRQAHFVAGDALLPAVLAQAGHGWDLVFADPPYAEAEAGGWERQTLLNLSGSLLRPGGWLVWESSARSPVPEVPVGWIRVRNRSKGSTAWRLYGKDDAQPVEAL